MGLPSASRSRWPVVCRQVVLGSPASAGSMHGPSYTKMPLDLPGRISAPTTVSAASERPPLLDEGALKIVDGGL